MTELKSLLDYTKVVPSKTKIVRFNITKDNPFYYYAGHIGAAYATEQTVKIIEVVSLKIHQKFPDRKDRRLCVGDGCLSNGATSLPWHEAHAEGTRNDFGYYTFEKNTTHYVPSWMDNSQRRGELFRYRVDQQMIWKKPDEGRVLLPVFDWERNFLFFYYICDILPASEILVSTRIRMELELKAKTKYAIEWLQIKSNIRDTGNTTWFHHLHPHADIGSKNRVNGFDVDWTKVREWLKCKV